MVDWGKICIATRLEKQVDSLFVQVWSRLVTQGIRKGDSFLMARDMVAHWAANVLVRRFLKSDADTLFFLDSDAEIGSNFLNEFRDHQPGWGFDALQAFYVRRGWPPRAIWFKDDSEGTPRECNVYGDVTEAVSYVGLHTVLIRREVFEVLLGSNDPEKFEWFYYPRGIHISEDVAFSRDAKAAGFKLGATSHVKAGHISRVTTGYETLQDFLEVNKHEAIRYPEI